MGSVDKPIPSDFFISPVDQELEKVKLEQEKLRHGNEVEKDKLRTSKWILGSCGFLLLLFYVAEIFIAHNSIAIDAQLRMLFIEPVRFVLTATIGYLFATKSSDK